jgi:hypothetical protein
MSESRADSERKISLNTEIEQDLTQMLEKMMTEGDEIEIENSPSTTTPTSSQNLKSDFFVEDFNSNFTLTNIPEEKCFLNYSNGRDLDRDKKISQTCMNLRMFSTPLTNFTEKNERKNRTAVDLNKNIFSKSPDEIYKNNKVPRKSESYILNNSYFPKNFNNGRSEFVDTGHNELFKNTFINVQKLNENLHNFENTEQKIETEITNKNLLNVLGGGNFNNWSTCNKKCQSGPQNLTQTQNLNFSQNNLGPTPEQNFPDFISDNFYMTFRGKFQSLITNYNGSRLLQKALPKTSSKIISLIFHEIKDFIPSLITHQYGNYFCQKLYLLLTLRDKIFFLQNITNFILHIATDKIGYYPLQTIIEKLSTYEEKEIIAQWICSRDNFTLMMREANSVHVVEKIILSIGEDQIKFIYDFAIKNFIMMSSNQNGICVIKKLLVHAQNFLTQKKFQKILIENFMFLIQNSFGNQTIQVAIEVKYFFTIFFFS